MAKLYFYYGAMGSSKTANALMVAHNYESRGQKALLVKSGIDTRDGARIIRSRVGIQNECVLLEEVIEMDEKDLRKYDCIIVDEIQFASASQIDFLAHIVDDLEIPVMCYGLRADFQNNLFEGSERLLAICDEIHEVKTMCWCGRKATCNARYNKNGIVREGSQIMLGADDDYIALCRKHFNLGMLQPNEKKDRE